MVLWSGMIGLVKVQPFHEGAPFWCATPTNLEPSFGRRDHGNICCLARLDRGALRTAEKADLTRSLQRGLPLAVYDPAKAVRDLVVSLAIGGDRLAGIAPRPLTSLRLITTASDQRSLFAALLS